MKKGLKLTVVTVLVLVLGLSMAGCGSDVAAGEKGGEALVLGENAFGVHFSLRKVSKGPVNFIVDPFVDKWGSGNVFEAGEGTAIWGNYGLVSGREKGNKAILDGSFTIYANDKSGPSVTVNVKGTYEVDEEDYCTSGETVAFYVYDDGQFIKSDRETVMAP